MDDLKSKGIKAFIWDFSGKIANHGLELIIIILLTRFLEPADFGLIAMIMVIVGIAQVFTDIGLGGALIQRKRVLQVHYSSVFYFNIFAGAGLSLLTFFSAPWIAAFYNNRQLIPLVQVISLSFIINAFSSVHNNKLRKELNYTALTKSRLIASLLSGIAGISLAYNGAGVWSLVAKTLSFGIIYNLIIWIVSQWTPSILFSFKALKQLWGFGFRMFLAGLLDTVYTRMDYVIIGKLFMPATLGFYQRAKSLNMLAIQYSSGSLMSVLFPILSKIQNDLPRFQEIIIKSLGIISFIVFFIFGGLYLISEELIVILFSEKWLPSAKYFKILAFSGFAYPINALFVSIIRSLGNSKAFLRIEIYKKGIAFLNLGIGFLYGVEGFLYGLIVVAIINTCINIIAASRESQIRIINFYKPIVIESVIAGIALLATCYAIDASLYSDIISLFIKASLFSLFYFFINLLLKPPPFSYFLKQLISIFTTLNNRFKTY